MTWSPQIAAGLKRDAKAKRDREANKVFNRLTPASKYTSCCLICKEFSKYAPACPKCNRVMINFGMNVKSVRKGSKKDWNGFIKAYAYQIYSESRSLLPSKEVEASRENSPARGVYGLAARQRVGYKNDYNQELLQAWVVKFDKFLTKKYRK